jgi:signal transduction histidine kinase
MANTERPWTISRFWLLQVIVLALAMIRLAATVAFHLNTESVAIEFSTLIIFIAPVLYATFNYGLAGALFTAGWVTVLAIPRFVAALSEHNYVGAWSELAQVALLDALAVLVGQRVTAEREARRLAESAELAHLSAEALYRNLFDSNQAPILLIDGTGSVIEANASARRAFNGSNGGKSAASGERQLVAPIRLVDMIGATSASQVLSQLVSEQLHGHSSDDDLISGIERTPPVAREIDGRLVLLRPTATMLDRSPSSARMQVVFEDVTAETRRNDLMEAYAARVVLGQEEERRHIAQELHDGPVQTLIHLCRKLDEVSSRDEDPSPGGTLRLSDLRVIVEETVAELRSIARGLRPSVLDDLGLVASINQIVSEAGERQRFDASFGVTGPERRMAPAVELALFRIAQEALSNAERHASANRVAVGLSFDDCGVRLLVTDDGVGFDIGDDHENADSGRLGLRGMTERARLIGSELTVHTGPGEGTTVDVRVPATIIT